MTQSSTYSCKLFDFECILSGLKDFPLNLVDGCLLLQTGKGDEEIISAIQKLPLIVYVLSQPIFYQTECNFHSQFPSVSDLSFFFVSLKLFATLICC